MCVTVEPIYVAIRISLIAITCTRCLLNSVLAEVLYYDNGD